MAESQKIGAAVALQVTGLSRARSKSPGTVDRRT